MYSGQQKSARLVSPPVPPPPNVSPCPCPLAPVSTGVLPCVSCGPVVGGRTAGSGFTGFVVGAGFARGFVAGGGLAATGSGFTGAVGRIGSGRRGGGVTAST